MDDILREQIYNNLILKETGDLTEIWQQRNLDEYEEERMVTGIERIRSPSH